MAIVNNLVLGSLIALGLAACVVTVGGVASLTDLQGVRPFRFAWFLGAFAIVTYIVGIIAIYVGFRRLRILILALYTVNTSLLSSKIDEFFNFKDANNPTGQAGASIDAVLAGLIVIVIVNFLLIFAIGYSEFEDKHAPPQNSHGSSGSDLDKKDSYV